MKILTVLTIAATALSFSATVADAKPKNCPPGLAKKSPACVPPGLAKKGVTAEEWSDEREDDDDDYVERDDDYDRDRWRRGDRISRDRYVVLDEGDRVIFDGREYVVIDTDNGTVLRRENDFYRLPRYDESDYVRVGDQVLRVDRETQEVIDLIRLADLVLN